MFRASCIRSRGFKLAITSEIIGKLGGRVEVIPVEAVNSGGRGDTILHTVHVPDGESWLIAAIGDMSPSGTSASLAPDLAIGDIKTNRYNTQNRMTVAGVHTGTVDVKMVKNSPSGTDSFTGHVYTVKL